MMRRAIGGAVFLAVVVMIVIWRLSSGTEAPKAAAQTPGRESRSRPEPFPPRTSLFFCMASARSRPTTWWPLRAESTVK